MQRSSVLILAAVLLAAVLLAAVLAGCRGEVAKSGPQSPPNAGPAAGAAAFTLTSTAFAEGQPIPKQFTEDGQDISPPLSWSGVPENTRQLALIVDDPDAPSKEPWVHWVIYDIPADAKGLSEGVPPDERLKEPAGAVEGKNSWTSGRTIGYRGPAPPPGRGHRYFFKLYALDTKLDLPPGLDKAALLKAMTGHIIGQGILMGTYQR